MRPWRRSSGANLGVSCFSPFYGIGLTLVGLKSGLLVDLAPDLFRLYLTLSVVGLTA